jgi:hypothetical protein
MDTQTARRFDMLKRVKQFGLAHAGDFPETSLGQQLFATLDELVSTLESLGVNYLSGLGAARSGVVTKSVARTALVNALIAIQRTSRSLVYDIPGLTGKFPQPRGLNDQTLLTTARSYAQAVTPHKDRLLSIYVGCVRNQTCICQSLRLIFFKNFF